MKITLISVNSGWAHYGIRYLSSSLRKSGYSTTLLFLPENDDYSEFHQKKIIELCNNSLFIGISSMTVYKYRALKLNSILKILRIPIIAGGLFPTLSPAEALENFDFICVGEGEHAVCDFAETLKNKSNNFNIQNVGYRCQNKNTFINECRNTVVELDSLPPPDYSGFEHYILNNDKIFNVSLTKTHNSPVFSTITSRGCPYSCTYCHNNEIQRLTKNKNRIVRYHSIDFSIEFLKNALYNYENIECIWIQDDDFLSRSLEEIQKFSKLWLAQIRKPFFILASPDNLSPEKINPLISAGLFQIFVGLQTGSPEILKLYNRKKITNEIIEKLNKLISLYKNKILIKFDFIVLNPLESESNILDSIHLILKLNPPFYLSMNVLTFMPNTPLFRLALKKKISEFDRTGAFHDNVYYRFTMLKKFKYHRYLNLILCLTGQNNTHRIRGFLPEFLIKILITKKVISFFNSNSVLTDKLIFYIEKIVKKYNIWAEKNQGINNQLPMHLIEYQKNKLSGKE